MNNIIYSDKRRVEKILKKIKKDGVLKLHFLADFDRTLTYSLINGEKKPSLISVIRSDPKYLGKKYSNKANKLFDHYYPIEIDPNISLEEKSKKMSEWWVAHLNLLVESGLNINHIDEIVNSGIIKLRLGVIKLLKNLYKQEIPLIILSANGLGGDSIIDYLKFNNLYTSNIEVVSNKFIFNEKGYAIGYDSNVIHVFNKGEVVFDNFPIVKEKIKGRKNIILLGDSLGDTNMADGVEYDNLLKIGFYNDKNDKNLDKYLEKFDILLTGDSDGDFLNNILTEKS
ncbi:MAG: hypothetical protein QM490_03880 [Candidatus Gracilibacteria bacterium]